MYDENNLGGVMPEEIEYNPDAPRKEAPTGVSAPVLDDFGYVAPTAKKDGPTGVSAPVLDDMASYNSGAEKKGAPTGVSAPVLDDNIPYVSEKKGAPTGVTAPVLDDSSVPFTQEKLVLSDEDIIGGLTPELKARFDALPADKQQQIIDMRRTQLGAVAPPVQVTAPVLDEDNYTHPPKKEEPKQ
ncbi:MAG: ABC transporter permease, partial [Ruminococcus sp.]|nr:ABC transporter permease [Ruminococcus sp.]